uniref:Uncharacterized protein n=1 Tax=Candidatus Nitrotoga fabula TaxID=2182327 RepID=A0A2X0SPZ8_9PROT|nr:protein of unknown function [Candidatus Nitrotoga fabula]
MEARSSRSRWQTNRQSTRQPDRRTSPTRKQQRIPKRYGKCGLKLLLHEKPFPVNVSKKATGMAHENVPDFNLLKFIYLNGPAGTLISDHVKYPANHS